jgi:SAM-dependent methyltransferase
MKAYDSSESCPICRAKTAYWGSKSGVRRKEMFHLHHCRECSFFFVANPCTDYTAIYDEQYYAGKGSDPMVDYVSEYLSPGRTIRHHDWQGIGQVVSHLSSKGRSWLDFGCGNGALVRHWQGRSPWQVFGFDTGAWANRARGDGLPILSEQNLAEMHGRFDAITSIEVIEHIPDPVSFLQGLRNLARPGAVLFLTTMNAEVAPQDFISWQYVIPEIHVSFFTPRALERALEASGFKPIHPGFVPGWEKIIRFKILKNLGFRENQFWHSLIPWPVLARLVDSKFKLTRLPAGIAI